MRRGRKSKRRQNKNDLLLKIGSALVICLVIGGISAALIFRPEPLLLNSENCPVDSSADKAIFIAVDTTDLMSERTVTEIRNRIRGKIDSAPEFSLVRLFEINENSVGHIRPLFSACKPPTGANANELVENPALIRKRFQENFDQPVRSVLQKLLEPKAANQSPIIEAIASVAVESMSGAASRSSTHELILVSDLIQHSDLFSMYQQFPKYAEFQKIVSKTGIGNFSLKDFAVELWVPPREVPIGERADLVKFWLELLIDRDAQPGTRMVPLS